jgi:hypothetical protein
MHENQPENKTVMLGVRTIPLAMGDRSLCNVITKNAKYLLVHWDKFIRVVQLFVKPDFIFISIKIIISAT